ncbi:formimidoylglutamate deiminase [Aliikangiella sp. G2MR2-5]|uniref:formimidoylglutamate deiminase n=1 Tax=Aliikangiella sp. G2MR2-5 TaxID=2788943 RepID=UPI0018A91F28
MKLYAEKVLVENQWLKNQSISIDNKGVITAIEPGMADGAEIIEGAVIPGMVNCHSHAFQRAFAGFSEYRANEADSFWSWRDIMYRFVAKMSPADAHIVARYLYLEMLKAGYTSVAEFHYLHHQVGGKFYDNPAEMSEQVINAAKSAGIAITHLPVLYTYAGFGKQAPSEGQGRFIHQLDQYQQLIETLFDSYRSDPQVQIGVAPHSLRAVSENQLKALVPFIHNLDANAPIHIHIAEQLKEVEDCIDFYKQRPVEWLLNNVEMDKNWCLIHATHLTDEEVSRLAKSPAVAGICPTTEANLGDGIYPTKDFMAQGGKVAIGSDSHIAVNVADELRTLEYGQRLTSHQRAVLTGEDSSSVGQYLYSHCAREGAKTVNQNVGEIAAGKQANLVVLDSNHPTLFLKEESFILDAAIFACDSLPVKDVMVSGQWKIIDGNHTDEATIVNDYLQVIKKLTQ